MDCCNSNHVVSSFRQQLGQDMDICYSIYCCGLASISPSVRTYPQSNTVFSGQITGTSVHEINPAPPSRRPPLGHWVRPGVTEFERTVSWRERAGAGKTSRRRRWRSGGGGRKTRRDS
eukprot:481784-Hanusia_phi.AAC.5